MTVSSLSGRDRFGRPLAWAAGAWAGDPVLVAAARVLAENGWPLPRPAGQPDVRGLPGRPSADYVRAIVAAVTGGPVVLACRTVQTVQTGGENV